MGKGGRKDWGGRKAGGPPVGEGFIWHTSELLTSSAWRTRSIHCARLLEFLEIEHLAHGGNANGSLLAPYNQLEKFGIGRRFISGAIKEAEEKGLVTVQRGALKGRQMTEVTRFCLTYLWTKTQSSGFWDWQLPTDSWKTYGRNIGAPLATIGAPLEALSVDYSELASVHHRVLPPSQPFVIATPDEVHESEHPSISWVRSSKGH